MGWPEMWEMAQMISNLGMLCFRLPVKAPSFSKTNPGAVLLRITKLTFEMREVGAILVMVPCIDRVTLGTQSFKQVLPNLARGSHDN